MSYVFVKTPDPIYIETVEEARYWCARFMLLTEIGVDTETTGLHRTKARVKFCSFSDGENRIACPVRLLPHFRQMLESQDIVKRLTNAKFDMHMFANHGILLGGKIRCTLPADFLLDEDRLHGLKESAKDHLGLRMSPFKEVFGNVGGVEAEVKCMCDIHDILEAQDADAAADMLVYMRRVGGDENVLKTLQKLHLSVKGDYTLGARGLIALAREHELAPRTAGKLAYVSDFVTMLGGQPLQLAERMQYASLLDDRDSIIDAHNLLLAALRKRIQLDMDPLEMLRLLVGDYASLDAWASYMLSDFYEPELRVIEMDEGYTSWDYYEEISTLYTRVLWNCERRGLGVDLALIKSYAVPMEKDIGSLERDMVQLTGNINLNLQSPLQLRELFYSQDPNTKQWIDPFGNPAVHMTKGGASGIKLPSTNEKALTEWAERGNDMATLLLEHRELTKLYGTYLSEDALPRHVDHRARIHTDLKQTGAVTLRLSSADPNLQNIPAKGEWGRRLRQCFVAGLYGDASPMWCLPELADVPVPDLPPDTPMTFIVADYEQLEVKVAAHVSRDPTLVDCLISGKDVHCLTSSSITGIPYDVFKAAKKAEHPTPEQEKLVDIRSGNKSALFGIFYGIGPVKLGGQLKKPIIQTVRNGRVFEKCPEASAIIQGVFDTYPGLKDCIEDTKQFCRDNLYVKTIAGRYRRLPDIISADRGYMAQAERQAFNSVVQGGAADIVVQAMLNCEADMELRQLGVRMLLQIHDELIFECPDIPEYVEAAKKRVRSLMENPLPMIVPVTVSMGHARSWGSAKT
jgi:DNA polymerase I-like protein with 3'-5' exonuclease and polymerase domains